MDGYLEWCLGYLTTNYLFLKDPAMQTDHFTVPFTREGNPYTLQVHTDPSTDDVDTYICKLNGERITQLRKDVGQWKQLWGELNQEEIQQLGEAIDTELTK